MGLGVGMGGFRGGDGWVQGWGWMGGFRAGDGWVGLGLGMDGWMDGFRGGDGWV